VDLGLGGHVAVVAASSKGLGRATAMQLAAEGARVVVSGRDEAEVRKTAAEIERATGSEAEPVIADLTRAADVEELVQRAVERFGSLEVLITNAGGPPPGSFDSFGDGDWQRAFELNLLSVVRLIRAALPHMRGRGYGRIVNFTSSSIKQPIDNLILSNTFRAGVLGLAKTLAGELAPDGILVNTIGPGRIATGRLFSIDEGQAERLGIPVEQVRERSESQIPLGRYGEPEEFARVAAFLASGANTYVTGQALLVDGGMVRAI
jgi:3-oxoacyl-[acyl-carrier protein] reductase